MKSCHSKMPDSRMMTTQHEEVGRVILSLLWHFQVLQVHIYMSMEKQFLLVNGD